MLKINKNKKFLLLGIILSFLFLSSSNVKSEEIDCTNHSCDYSCSDTVDDEAKEKCKKLEEQCKANLKVCELKVKEQKTLSSQLEIIEQEQESSLNQLYTTKKEVASLGEEIDKLEKDIQERKEAIEKQKKIIAGLVQRYYEYHREGVLNIILAVENLGTVLSQSDYLEQSGSKITDMLSELQDAKKALEEDQNELKGKKDEEEDKKEKLEDQYYSLKASEQQKQNLLEVTHGEEEKYQQILAKLEEQKKYLFDFGAASNIDSVLGSVSGYDQPDKKYKLSTSWYYSQRDSRWKDKKIGGSSYRMEDWGCAVASVAMMYTYYGKDYSPKDILDDFSFTQGLIYWPSSWRDTGYGYTNYKSKLNDILDDDDVAIIHIHVYNGGHFLVVGGKDKKDYIVHDPYFGSNLYLGTSLSLMSKLSGSSAYVDRIIYK